VGRARREKNVELKKRDAGGEEDEKEGEKAATGAAAGKNFIESPSVTTRRRNGKGPIREKIVLSELGRKREGRSKKGDRLTTFQKGQRETEKYRLHDQEAKEG